MGRLGQGSSSPPRPGLVLGPRFLRRPRSSPPQSAHRAGPSSHDRADKERARHEHEPIPSFFSLNKPKRQQGSSMDGRARRRSPTGIA
ncbi:hypothetical protein NL676_037798 [Syzygium grande]|nr:hypothetical protein NL676_037798 [Syzygium grande]